MAIVNLTNMDIAFNGQPFVELPAGTLDLLPMDVAYKAQPFVRQSGLVITIVHKLLFSGSTSGSKLLLLGNVGNHKLKIG